MGVVTLVGPSDLPYNPFSVGHEIKILMEPRNSTVLEHSAKTLGKTTAKLAVGGGAGLLRRVILRVGFGVGNRIRLLYLKASTRYVKRYAERHGLIKVLGMRAPARMEDLYTRAAL